MGEQRDSGARVMVCSTACVNKSAPDANSVLKNCLLCLIIRPQINIRKMCDCSDIIYGIHSVFTNDILIASDSGELSLWVVMDLTAGRRPIWLQTTSFLMLMMSPLCIVGLVIEFRKVLYLD